MQTFCFISQRVCPNLVPGREPRYGYREYPICNCVHSYSISPCQTPFFKNMSFATITKPWSLTELVINCVHTGTQCPLLCPSTSSRSCTRAPAPCPNSSMGMLGKRVCSYQCPASTVLGHRVRAPSVKAALLFCLQQRKQDTSACRLFVPLMSNSAFNKTEQFFFVGIKSFLVYSIRRYTGSFRFILISYYCILCSARRNEYALVRTKEEVRGSRA